MTRETNRNQKNGANETIELSVKLFLSFRVARDCDARTLIFSFLRKRGKVRETLLFTREEKHVACSDDRRMDSPDAMSKGHDSYAIADPV